METTMTRFRSIMLPFCIVSGAVALSACSDAPQGQPSSRLAQDVSPASAQQPQGLHLTDSSSSHVAGTFVTDKTTIQFDIIDELTQRHVVVQTAAGEPLTESVVRDDGSYTVRILGGQRVIEADGKGEVRTTGDQAVESRLAEMAEAESFAALWPALSQARAPAGSSPPEVAAGGPPFRVTGSSKLAPEVVYNGVDYYGNPCGSWNGPGQWGICGTTFLGWTDLYLINCTTRGQLVMFNGLLMFVLAGTQYGDFIECGYLDEGGWWWGQTVLMQNWGTSLVYYGHNL